MIDQNNIILYELVTKGIYHVEQPYDLAVLNTELRFINCIAKEWYNKEYIILVHNTQRKDKNDISVMKSLINGRITAEVRARLPFLIENGWIEDNELSKKFLVQYKNFVLEYCNKYKECALCKILVKNADTHEYCTRKREEIMNKIMHII